MVAAPDVPAVGTLAALGLARVSNTAMASKIELSFFMVASVE
jgi:hypothetical protein